MKAIIISVILLLFVSDSIGQRVGLSRVDSILLSKLQSGLKVNTDSLNSVRGKVKVMEALLVKQQATLAKKDTVWLSGFGGYGTRFAPFNQTAVKNEIAVLKKNVADLKTALAVIRAEIASFKTEMALQRKSINEIKAALIIIRKDIADIQAKMNKP